MNYPYSYSYIVAESLRDRRVIPVELVVTLHEALSHVKLKVAGSMNT